MTVDDIEALVALLRDDAERARNNWPDVFSVDPDLVERAADAIDALRERAEKAEAELDALAHDVERHVAVAGREAERAERLAGLLREVVEAWDWWQVDTYDRCQSVPSDAIREARRALEDKTNG